MRGYPREGFHEFWVPVERSHGNGDDQEDGDEEEDDRQKAIPEKGGRQEGSAEGYQAVAEEEAGQARDCQGQIAGSLVSSTDHNETGRRAVTDRVTTWRPSVFNDNTFANMRNRPTAPLANRSRLRRGPRIAAWL